MSTFATYFKTALDVYFRVLKVILTVLMAVLIVPVSLQIISRYTDIVDRYIWTEEVARFCFIWIVMIGSMVAVRDGSHFKVDLLPRAETEQQAGIADLIVHVLMLTLAIVFVAYGSEFALFGSIQKSEMSGIDMLSIYIAFPLAGATWTLFLLERIAGDLRRVSQRAGGSRA